MLLLLNWAGPALARRVSTDRAAGDGWGAHTPPCAPFCCSAVRPGGAEKASPGLSFGVNDGLKFLKIAGLKFPRSDVRFGRQPHNRDPTRATRIAGFSTLRL